MATRKTCESILNSYGTALAQSHEDASLASDSTIPREDAIACVADLEQAGIEASWAPDEHDSQRAWIHVTLQE